MIIIVGGEPELCCGMAGCGMAKWEGGVCACPYALRRAQVLCVLKSVKKKPVSVKWLARKTDVRESTVTVTRKRKHEEVCRRWRCATQRRCTVYLSAKCHWWNIARRGLLVVSLQGLCLERGHVFAPAWSIWMTSVSWVRPWRPHLVYSCCFRIEKKMFEYAYISKHLHTQERSQTPWKRVASLLLKSKPLQALSHDVSRITHQMLIRRLLLNTMLYWKRAQLIPLLLLSFPGSKSLVSAVHAWAYWLWNSTVSA